MEKSYQGKEKLRTKSQRCWLGSPEAQTSYRVGWPHVQMGLEVGTRDEIRGGMKVETGKDKALGISPVAFPSSESCELEVQLSDRDAGLEPHIPLPCSNESNYYLPSWLCLSGGLYGFGRTLFCLFKKILSHFQN